MAWIPTTQYTATFAGATWEFGTVVVASNEVEVTTRMKTVWAAFATYSADPTAADSIWIGRTISAGAVTIKADFDGTVNYLFIGR